MGDGAVSRPVSLADSPTELPTVGREVLRLPALQVRDLVKVYRGAHRAAVDGLTFRLEEGEIFGLLGPNGAGKTTAISVLCTLLRPTSGSISVGGIDLTADPRQVRRLIGLVPQEIALYPRLSARENLRYFGRLHGLHGSELAGRIGEALATVGLQEHADREVGLFSGGMKRRANLAAGILHRPRILFLDEPTVGVDPQSRSLILDYLAGLRATGTTVVYTTHYMEEAQQLCSRVAVMDGGRIIAEGPPAELMAKRRCADLEEVFLQLTGRHLRD
jgi:ABC-2 type transport system ATP-binding protein